MLFLSSNSSFLTRYLCFTNVNEDRTHITAFARIYMINIEIYALFVEGTFRDCYFSLLYPHSQRVDTIARFKNSNKLIWTGIAFVAQDNFKMSLGAHANATPHVMNAFATALADVMSLSPSVTTVNRFQSVIDSYFNEHNNPGMPVMVETVDFLTRTLTLTGDLAAEIRRDSIVAIFGSISASNQGCSMLATGGAFEGLCSLLTGSTTILAHNVMCTTARLCSRYSTLALLSLAAKNSSLTYLSAYLHQDLMPRIRLAQETESNSITDIVMYTKCCNAVFMLCTSPGSSLLYPAVSILTPSLFAMLKHSWGLGEAATSFRGLVRAHTLRATAGVFSVDIEDSDSCADFEEFALSDTFDCVTYGDLAAAQRDCPAMTSRLLLLRRAVSLSDEMLARIFTPARLSALCGAIGSEAVSGGRVQTLFVAVMARVAAAVPGGAARLLQEDFLSQILSRLKVADSVFEGTFSAVSGLAREVTRLLDALLKDTDYDPELVQLVLERDGLEYCTRVLLAAALCDRNLGVDNDDGTHIDASGFDCDTAATLLRVLRQLIAIGDTDPDATVMTEGMTPHNAFAAAFLKARGLQAIDLLRFTDCMTQDSPALHELWQLRALLERMALIPTTHVETAEDMLRRR